MKLDSLWGWEVAPDDYLVIEGHVVRVIEVNDLVDYLEFTVEDDEGERTTFVTGPFEGVLHVTSFESDEDEMFVVIGETWED